MARALTHVAEITVVLIMSLYG